MGQIDFLNNRFNNHNNYTLVNNKNGLWYSNGKAYTYLYNYKLNFPNKKNIFNIVEEQDLSKIIDINIESNYLVSKEVNKNYVKLVFKNVDNNNIILNYYTIELILRMVDNYIIIDRFFIYTSEKNSSFKYNIECDLFNTQLVEFDKEIFLIENQNQANLKTSELIDEDVARNNFTRIELKNILGFNIINNNNLSNYIKAPYNDNKNLLFTFKAIGEISTDITKIYVVKKNYYRQGLLKQTDFISLPKLKKHFFIGRNKVNDDIINESLHENKGNVRIFQNSWKQAKYIESDN